MMNKDEGNTIDALEAGVDDELFGSKTPSHIIDILKVMKKEDDNRPGNNKVATLAYNPVWRVLAEHIKAQQSRIDGLLAPLEFNYEPGRPLMIVKLGSDSKGWIPNAKHFDAVRKVLKASGEDLKKNILLFHYAIMIEEHHQY